MKRIRLNYEDGEYTVRGKRVGQSVVWVRTIGRAESPIEVKYNHDYGKPGRDDGEWEATQWQSCQRTLSGVLADEVRELKGV